MNDVVIAPGRADRAAAPSPSPEAIAQAYAVVPSSLRRRLLACLLGPLGTLAIAAVASGAFARFAERGAVARIVAAAEDIGRVGAEQVLDLARFAEQVDPDTLVRAGAMIGEAFDGLGAAGVGGSALLLALRAWWLVRRRDGASPGRDDGAAGGLGLSRRPRAGA